MHQVTIRGGVVAIPLAMLSDAETREDWRAVSVENEKRAAAERLRQPQAFRIPERVSSFVFDGDHALYPIAAAQVYRQRLRDKSHELRDERARMPARPLPYAGRLFDYQTRAVDALSRVHHGVLIAACGAGKGEIIGALVGRLGLSTLVVVSQLEQAAELRDRLSRRLSVAVGMVGAGERSIERITIAVIQSLDDATLEEIAPLFEVVIRDEVHHAAAPSELALWRRLHARRFYGFTATPRTDGLQPLVHHFFGPVAVEIKRDELVSAGRAVDPEIREVRTGFSAAYRGPADWPALLVAIERDEARDRLIVDTVMREGAGELSAVLTGRLEHAETMGAALRARGKRVAVLSSRRSKKERVAIVEAARTGDLDVIIGTQILDEGIDVAPLSRVFLVWPAKAEGRIVQRIGRALRPLPGKSSPVVFDFVDLKVGVLANQARKRRIVFAKHWPASIVTRAA